MTSGPRHTNPNLLPGLEEAGELGLGPGGGGGRQSEHPWVPRSLPLGWVRASCVRRSAPRGPTAQLCVQGHWGSP